MSRVQFEFPDKAKVISLLASVYEDPRVALAEFIVNGMDAGAHTIHITPVTGKVNSVVVLDDGYGMSQREMERIVANLANSIKTSPEELQKRHIDPARVIGKMGIGILGFQSFARKVVFISKMDDSGPVWRMAMERAQIAADIEPALGKDKERLANISRGTAVELIDISRDTMRLFSPKTLQQYLEKNFAALLRREDAAAVFVGDQRVTPPPLEGTLFPIPRLQIGEFGEAEVSLSVVASGIGLGDGVALTSKGRTVVKEIIRLPEFQHAPWTDGVLHGSIEAPFLTVAPTRSNYARDAAFEELVHAVLSLEERLTSEIEKAREKRSLEQQSDALQKLREAMGHALHELELEGSRTQTRNIGGVIGAGITGGTAHAESGGPSTPKGGPPSKPPEEGVARKPDHSQLNLDWRHLGTHVHSQLGEGGLVIVNEDCPDYKEECSSLSSQRTLRYLAKLAAKELVRRNLVGADTDEVMERAIQLELSALRHMGTPRDKESSAR
jgi:hypothetical protein